MKEDILKEFITCVQGMFLKVDNIVILQHGEKVAEKHWAPDIPKDQYSVSKSFTSTAIGIAIDEGLLSLDDRVADFFQEEIPENPQDKLNSLTLRHLLMMSSGHIRAMLMRDERRNLQEKDWVRLFLRKPIYVTPGEQFFYSNGDPYMAGMMLQKAARQNLVDYMMPRVFEPLNISRPMWEQCPLGHTFASGGLEITTEELSRFGQLYLQMGKWEGKQLVSENWIRKATLKQIDTNYPGDWSHGYGYQFWRCSEDAYRADGRYGQFCIVIPKKDAVIAINSRENRTQLILDKVWSEILPRL